MSVFLKKDSCYVNSANDCGKIGQSFAYVVNPHGRAVITGVHAYSDVITRNADL
ncbi:hypothetical protein [Agriterribacter sp.]|uniref:hypothetical protein n=1 Tax=Agriterribacter sp. TaxID=2821509 RepID=UPI002B61BB36|nr:hypothetical protein [Agriterribacter sp.]HTN06595.1 hypothetical protein [Agriterribacter sp.]